jgi:diguanylate cyclase (GGDEF)-like protein/PAS domain S-box-containing protein
MLVESRYIETVAHKQYPYFMNRALNPRHLVADALQLIGLPACACDSQGSVIAVNAALAALLCCDEAALVGQSLLLQIAHERRAADAGQLLSGMIGQGESLCWDSVLLDSHGAEIEVNVCAKAQSDGCSVTLVFADLSRHLQTEKVLRKTLLEQQATLENASVGIIFTKSRLVQGLNPRASEMFGYQENEIIGRTGRIFYPDQASYDKIGVEAAPLLAAGQPYETEIELRRKNGELFWCRMHSKAVNRQHPDEGTIWIVEDIGERRRDEQTLRHTLLEMQAVMSNAPVAITVSRGRRIVRYNQRFGEMFGFAGEAGIGQSTSCFFPSCKIYDDVIARARPLLSNGKPFQEELELRRQDNTMLWGQLIGYLLNPEDPVQGTIWIIDDRTEQKRAEESLHNALMVNQAILENALIGIAMVEHGRILRCNGKMEEIFGYAAGEASGRPVRDFYPSETKWQADRLETIRYFADGQVHATELIMMRKDGSTFWAQLSGRPVDPSLPKGRSVWLIEDVTQRKRAEASVLAGRDELEARVLERTAELAGANSRLQAEIDDRRQAEQQVRYMAYHDILTGLPNRALLSDRLRQAMLAARRSSSLLAVMFIDLDRFKSINDTLGHMIGDHLLKEVAVRLSCAVRASDTIARLGGDEFVVVLPDLAVAEEAAQVAQKIIDTLADHFPLEGQDLHITPSIGISIYPIDGKSVETLMRNADTAMYHAKASGRNNFQFFTEQMNQAVAQNFELERNLHGALARGEFELYYQPIMDVATRRLHAMEVLLRWHHPTKDLVFPDLFIPIIEENGLIVPIGEWVMRRACEQNIAWQRQGLPVVPLAVNLSPRQFLQRGLVDSVASILADTGLDPALLELEITETALMQHGAQTLDTLSRISAMGIRLSIDDFGTGYSSLAYLKRFPVQKIKIDRTFIKELDQSADDRAIVSAIIALSNSLQLSVVAEGVETEAQFALLRKKGSQFAQGYLFSRPLPAEMAVRFFTEYGEPMLPADQFVI